MVSSTWSFLTLAFAAWALQGCNSIFFQPDSEIYSVPASYDPPARESFLVLPQRAGQSAPPEKIHMWTLLPAAQPKAMVVQFHGNAQNLTSHVQFLSWIVGHGYGLVIFDYRGYGRSSGTPSREKAIEDGERVLADVAKNYPALPMVVVAQSLGGALGAVAVSRFEQKHPGRVQGLVLDSTFGSWRGLARRKIAQTVVGWPLQFPLSYLVSDKHSASDALASLALPLFQTHATDDLVVPFEAGLALSKSYRGSSKAEQTAGGAWPPQFLATTGGHTSAFTSLPGNVRQALIAFLARVTVISTKQQSGNLAPTVD